MRQANRHKEKTLNQLYKESGKKLSFKQFAKEYNESIQKSLVSETVNNNQVVQQSSGKDFSGLQILAVLGVVVGIYLLMKKD